MGDGASDMQKDFDLEASAVRWVEKLVPKILAKRPMDKYTIVRKIEEMKHAREPEVWSWGPHNIRVHIVERALTGLVVDKVVCAEPDDHTSLYSLNSPLDRLAQSV